MDFIEETLMLKHRLSGTTIHPSPMGRHPSRRVLVSFTSRREPAGALFQRRPSGSGRSGRRG